MATTRRLCPVHIFYDADRSGVEAGGEESEQYEDFYVRH